MEGTHNEETEAIQESDEEFAADQSRGETRTENESAYQSCTSRKFVRYPQQGRTSAHRRGHTTVRSRRTTLTYILNQLMPPNLKRRKIWPWQLRTAAVI